MKTEMPEGKTSLIKKDCLFDENNTLECRIILHQSESIPENATIHKIHLIVALGKIALELNKMEKRIYLSGSVITIPAKTSMNISNLFNDESEILMLKT